MLCMHVGCVVVVFENGVARISLLCLKIKPKNTLKRAPIKSDVFLMKSVDVVLM
jgi:hypothetical protein